MERIDINNFLRRLERYPTYILTEMEKAMKKSAVQVRDRAVKKFGIYQPSVGELPAWAQLKAATIKAKEDAGGGEDPLIGHYSGSSKNTVWPQHLRNTIGWKVEGTVAVVGTDDPLGPHHEYGAPRANIPPRPFLRPALYESYEDIKDNVRWAIQIASMRF